MNIAYANPTSPVKLAVSHGLFESVIGASFIVQITLLILALLSVFCWAAILAKRKQLNAIRAANEDFLQMFWNAPSLDHIYSKISEYPSSALASVFKAGFQELQRLAESSRSSSKKNPTDEPVSLMGHDNLGRALRRAMDSELLHIENRLNLLASTSSLAPFVGLFGTVVGIMNAFEKIGVTGSASLAVVAPGISEALFTTAVGLATALPAGAAYNYFLGRIRREETELTNFISDFLNIAKRNFFKED